MSMEGIGRDSSNIDRLSNIQNTSKKEGVSNAPAIGLPSSETVRKELTGRENVNVSDINAAINSTIKGLKDGSGKSFSSEGAINSVILATLTPPQGAASAAKTIAEKLNKSEESPSLGSVIVATIAQTFSKRLN